MLKINKISFAYGEKQIFSNFSLDVNDGDRICLFGQSGCGKTTLIRLIAGLENQQSGIIEGIKDKKISYCFQEDRLLPFKTVLENITLMGANEEKAKTLLNELGLGDEIDSKPESLSGGMKKRVALARALAQEFDILLLDEPFTALDEENIHTAIKVVDKYSRGKTVILVTHSQSDANELNCKIVNFN